MIGKLKLVYENLNYPRDSLENLSLSKKKGEMIVSGKKRLRKIMHLAPLLIARVFSLFIFYLFILRWQF